VNKEILTGIVNRVTFHSESTGWSVLKVQNLDTDKQETVTVHQTKVYAGATIEFHGEWSVDKKYGRQFKAVEALEKKPATTASLEKYLGSGLIKGVGTATAKKIVAYFKGETLDIFEGNIDRLTEVPGISLKKLKIIKDAWSEHRSIRKVMMFLQDHGISSLFAVKIFKEYGDEAINRVTSDPYCLANDFYGIGFLSADKVALSIGFGETSEPRMIAAIKHVLSGSRDNGHCYLTDDQINEGIIKLIQMNLGDALYNYLAIMKTDNQLCTRTFKKDNIEITGYYSKSLFYEETAVAKKLNKMNQSVLVDESAVENWILNYCNKNKIPISIQQAEAVAGIGSHKISVLTGGPGCGKTTTTLVLVKLLSLFLKKNILLAAPTGRAAQRMSEVIGREAKTIHRLLDWRAGKFVMNENNQLSADFLIVDESSMLDISLSAALLKAIPDNCQLLLIGDPDQIPSVGAGNVLSDIISSNALPCYRLTKVFRQAQESSIIKFAHEINKGRIPEIESPFKNPKAWDSDCIFIDSDEATQEQLKFVTTVKKHFQWKIEDLEGLSNEECPFSFKSNEDIKSAYEKDFVVPEKFQHVSLNAVNQSKTEVDALKAVMQKVHPWSSLHYGLSAVEVVVRLYLEWIPKYKGRESEVQILTPMTRGSLGTANLNKVIQERYNPFSESKNQIMMGEKIFRKGDRIIHKRNNYDLNVFNGDIGKIISINNEDMSAVISFYPDGREVSYEKENLLEIDLAYAITIHKSQGSEFEAVIIPVLTQHFKMLYRNLIYTGLTRAKKLASFVGTRKALNMAIRQQDVSKRQTALKELLG